MQWRSNEENAMVNAMPAESLAMMQPVAGGVMSGSNGAKKMKEVMKINEEMKENLSEKVIRRQ